jgi:hypothetical protein
VVRDSGATDRLRQGCWGARLHPEKRLSGDSTKTSHFAITSAVPIDMREYVAQAGSAACILPRAPFETPIPIHPPLSLAVQK